MPRATEDSASAGAVEGASDWDLVRAVHSGIEAAFLHGVELEKELERVGLSESVNEGRVWRGVSCLIKPKLSK